MHTKQKDLWYFRLRLQELLDTSFPEKANNQKFIQQRSSRVGNAYEDAFQSVNDIEKCNEIATITFFLGVMTWVKLRITFRGFSMGGEIEAQIFNFEQKLNPRTAIELSSFTPLLQNTCCAFSFFVVYFIGISAIR